MRVLVTGAGGYAGFYAALRLVQAGHSVVGLVRRPEMPRLNVLRMQEIRLVAGDVGDPAAYRDELQRSDVVVHTAFDRKRLRETDRALFEALRGAEPPPGRARRRLIYTTGSSIVGNFSVPILDETTPPNPDYPLAFRCELEREALALENVGVTVLRPCFMFGNDGYNSMTSDWFSMAAEGDAVFRGNRERRWTWLHVQDLAEAYRLVLEADDVEGEIFNLADDREYPKTLDVMRACLNVAGFEGEPRFEGPMKGDSASTWFNQDELVSSAKAHRVLGWTPRHPVVLQAVASSYASWRAANGR